MRPQQPVGYRSYPGRAGNGERGYNFEFKGVEFDYFKSLEGLNSFVFTSIQ